VDKVQPAAVVRNGSGQRVGLALAAAAMLLAATASVSTPARANAGPAAGQGVSAATTTVYLPLTFSPPEPPPADQGAIETTTKTYLPLIFKPYPPPPNTFFGVVGSSIEALDFPGYPGNLDSNAMLRHKSMYWLQNTGVNYYRNYGSDSRIYSWRFVNPANNVYDWSKWDLLVQSSQDYNISLLATIGNGVPAWANGTSDWREQPLDLWTDPLETTAWYKYVRAFVERYDGDGYQDMPGLQKPIKYYEMWNEPDLRQGWVPPAYIPHQFNGDVNDYVRLTRVGYQAVKDADPSATVVGPATAQTAGNEDLAIEEAKWFIWNWPQWMAAGGLNYVDIVSFTRYPDKPNWDAINYVDYFLFFAEHNRGGKPVWLTETGWGGSSTDPSQTKASNFARFTFQAWNRAFVQRFFWYSYHEPAYPDVTNAAAKALISTTQGPSAIGTEPDPYFHPLYRAVEVLVDVFGAFTADDHPAAIPPNENVRVYRFDKDGQTVWAAWIKATSGSQTISLDTNGRTVRVIGLFGDDLGTFSGGDLVLGPWPIYLTTNLTWNENIGRITGRVHTTTAAWTNGAAGLTVQAAGGGLGTYTAVTDADGNYIISGLPEGSYTVTVLGQNTTPASQNVTVEREAPWGRTSFTIN